MSRDRSVAGLSLGLVLAMGACASHGARKLDGMTAPGGDAEKGASAGGEDRLYRGDDIDQLDAELAQAQAELQQLQLGEGGGATHQSVEPEVGVTPQPTPPAGSDRCERIELLADRICQLRDRMCDLAAEHTDQSRYSEACGRAEQTCEQAQQAADDCTVG